MRVKVTKNYVMTTIVEDVESWDSETHNSRSKTIR
jgi:hypothetical protein